MRTGADLAIDFAVTARPAEGGTVVTATGEIDVAAAPLLREALIQAHDPVVVDLSGATFMDACGVGVLVGAAARARRAGSDIVLRDPSRPVMRVLELTGLLPVFRWEWGAVSGSVHRTLSHVA